MTEDKFSPTNRQTEEAFFFSLGPFAHKCFQHHAQHFIWILAGLHSHTRPLPAPKKWRPIQTWVQHEIFDLAWLHASDFNSENLAHPSCQPLTDSNFNVRKFHGSITNQFPLQIKRLEVQERLCCDDSERIRKIRKKKLILVVNNGCC